MKIKLLLLSMVCFSNLFGQVKENEVILKNKNGIPKIIQLRDTKVSSNLGSVKDFIRKLYKVNENSVFKKTKQVKTKNNVNHERIQQYYQGIKVEYAILNAVSNNGNLKSLNGKYIPVQSLATIPSLKESDALQFALNHIGAREYAWQSPEKEKIIKRLKKSDNASYFPKGELVIVEKDMYSDNPIPTLAYKFDVYAINPISRKNYYIDANTGELIFSDEIIKHIEGIATTRYSGERTIETEEVDGQFRLRDVTRGNGITTFNNYNKTFHDDQDYIDDDNVWTAVEYDNDSLENAGLDAHWGTMMSYDYFSLIHGRNSIDNEGYELINYVNANLAGWSIQNNDNAFWDGNVMTYGMGTNYGPFTTIDIVGHELAHGLDQESSELIYQATESGAINEGLSDIWGAMIKFFADPEKDTYLVGEEVGYTIRSLENPKEFNNPDTYLGIFWDYGTSVSQFVHTNSGIMGHMFYLLAEGSSETDGVNDNGDTFSFDGIGRLDASRIMYRAQTLYFTPTTDYIEARFLTMLAAQDLFGKNSQQVFTLNQAWYAVGLVGEISGHDILCDKYPSYYFIDSIVPNTTVFWSVTSNLEIVNVLNGLISVRPIDGFVNGLATISASVDGVIISKDIWIGSPTLNFITELDEFNIAYEAFIDVEEIQNITSVEWEVLSGNGNIIPNPSNNFYADISGGAGEWLIEGKVTVTNDCGETVKFFTLGNNPPPGNEYQICSLGNDIYKISKNTSKCISTEEEIYKQVKMIVYNIYGRPVLSVTSNRIDLSRLKHGVYIINAIIGNELIAKRIIK